MKELIADWSHALVLVIVPGALVGALLKRWQRRLRVALAICIAAEALTLTPFALGLVKDGSEPILDMARHPWQSEVSEGLLLLHILLLLPILLAVSIGYVGRGCIQTRRVRRTN